MTKKLAFHVCCAPCMILPTEALRERFDELTLVFYNPNIAPREEYELRRACVVEQAARLDVPLVEFDYDHECWEREVDASAPVGERCEDCYRIRLEKTAAWAREQGYTHLSTSLSISPYQYEDRMFEIGKELATQYGLEFLDESFSDKYFESREVARDLNLYRQNYCGCLPSKAEAEADRAARRAARKAAAAQKQPLRTQDFDYPLKDEQIAQEPLSERESCKLLVLHKQSGEIEHKIFSDLIDYLDEGDVLVLNETRVLPARLKGTKADTHAKLEVLLLKEEQPQHWECLIKPGRKARAGTHIEFHHEGALVLKAEVLEERGEGVRLLRFESANDASVFDLFHTIGETPLPPYITKRLDNPEMYQTVFSADEHSAAAPTAGLHFSEELLARIQAKGIGIAKLRLDVGLDTFRPVKVDNPYEHHIHTEYIEVPQACVDAVLSTKAAGRKVVAVGTTACRALESAYQLSGGALAAYQGPTSLFILPGYRFGAVDALITNFHVPKSTLMMMVSAFSSIELISKAYQEASEQNYRFLSFGDAMFMCD